MAKACSTVLFWILCIPFIGLSQDADYYIHVEAGYKTLRDFVPEAGSGGYENCGYCDVTYGRKNTEPIWGQGGYLQATFEVGRWVIPLQIGVMRWDDKIEGSSRMSYFQPHAPSWWGPIVHYREYMISYRSVSTYLNLSFGTGFNVLRPATGFFLGPVLKVNPQAVISRREITNSVTEHYKHYENPPIEDAEIDEESYSNSNNAEDFIRFDKDHSSHNFLHLLSVSAGIRSHGIVYRNCGYAVEGGYQLRSFSRIAMGGIEQWSSWYVQVGCFYRFGLKN